MIPTVGYDSHYFVYIFFEKEKGWTWVHNKIKKYYVEEKIRKKRKIIVQNVNSRKSYHVQRKLIKERKERQNLYSTNMDLCYKVMNIQLVITHTERDRNRERSNKREATRENKIGRVNMDIHCV